MYIYIYMYICIYIYIYIHTTKRNSLGTYGYTLNPWKEAHLRLRSPGVLEHRSSRCRGAADFPYPFRRGGLGFFGLI